MRKYFISIFMITVVSLFLSLNISAEEIGEVEIRESEDVFGDFIKVAEIDNIKVINSSGVIIKNEISERLKNQLELQNYNIVYEILENNNWNLQYSIEDSQKDVFGVYSIGSTINRTVYEYHLEYDNSGTLRKEWLTDMNISYRENANGTFTALSNPSINVTANFGAAFNEEVSSISTGYRYVSGNTGIDFYASYRMRARIVFPISIGGFEIPIGKWYDWGSVNPTYNLR